MKWIIINPKPLCIFKKILVNVFYTNQLVFHFVCMHEFFWEKSKEADNLCGKRVDYHHHKYCFKKNKLSCLVDVLVVAMFGVVVTQEMNIVVTITWWTCCNLRKTGVTFMMWEMCCCVMLESSVVQIWKAGYCYYCCNVKDKHCFYCCDVKDECCSNSSMWWTLLHLMLQTQIWECEVNFGACVIL